MIKPPAGQGDNHSAAVLSATDPGGGGLLEKSVALALERRILVLILSAFLSGLGVWSFFSMHVDAVPEISNIQVQVTTNARGLAPEEVEQFVTYPVEFALQNMPGLSYLRSISKYSLSQVTAVFEDGTDIYFARQQVTERLRNLNEQMPESADVKIALGPIATGLSEVFQFQVKGPGYSLSSLRDILDWQIIPRLKMIKGVDEVQAMGSSSKEYQVWLDPERMHGYGLHSGEVFAALSRNNGNAGGGYTQECSDRILIRAEGRLRTISDLAGVVIRRDESGTVRVRDVGRAIIGKKLPQSIATRDARGEVVIGVLVMRRGESSREVIQRVKASLKKLSGSLPANVTIEPFYDRSLLIDRTISTVEHNLVYGALFVLAVLFALLGSVRAAIIAALSIPLSLSGSLLFLNLSGTSGNLLSLGAIDFGILIDGSVFMVENVASRLCGGAPGEKLEIVKAASAEVAAPVLFAVLIITAVYLPIVMLPGVSGKTFAPMALTMVFGLLTALWIALYLTPVLSYFWLKQGGADKETIVMRVLRRAYRPALHFSLRHPLLTAGASVCVFAASLLGACGIGTEFLPVLKEGSVVLTVNRPVSASLKEAGAETTLIESILKEIPEVTSVVSRTGHSEIAFDPQGPDETDTFVNFANPGSWRPGISQQLLEDKASALIQESVPGAMFSISQPIEQRMNELLAGAKEDIAVRIYGPDLGNLRRLAVETARLLSSLPGSAGVKVEQTTGLPVVTAFLKHEQLAAYGIAAQDALDVVTASVDGKVVGTIFEGKPRYNLVVRFEPKAVESAEDIGNLPVLMSAGGLVPLKQVASITRKEGPALISHRQGDRVLTVQVNVRNRSLGEFIADAQSLIEKKLMLPAGYRIEWGGQFENMREAQSRLIILVPLALGCIFLLLQGLYNDTKPALLIFANVPLALSGGIFGLLACDMYLSVTAAVGFTALFGVAVLNGVVLVSTIRRLEQQGLKPRLAALSGARQRLRPVLMTALVAALGFLPMALSTTTGAEVQRPLATVIISGLFTSTILTLLVLPGLYPLVCSNSVKNKKGR